MPASAWAEADRPKLVVSIVIDQLRTDYIEFLHNYFTQKGFNRLMTEGAYFRDVDFKTDRLDATSATAMLYTGSYPSKTGIPAAQTYKPDKKRMGPVLSDPTGLGNFTETSYSPENLRLSTISDEVAIDGLGLSLVYALSADPQQAVIMAGHSGTNGAWINTETGNWATTTYYQEFPQPLSTRNYSSSIASRLDTMQWKPMLDISKYPGVPAQKRIYPFRHTFPRSDRDVYKRFTASPMGNTEVTDMAIEYLRTLKPGARGDAMDMLNIGYTLAPYKYVADGDYRIELTDAYLRLDSQLGRLFEAIDKYVGQGNTLIWVSSTGYYDDAVLDDRKYRIPGGEFSMKRAKSLLNSYLSARHGNADYVESFRNGEIYLDHKTLEDRNLETSAVLADARAFIAKMSGVADVYTLDDILSANNDEEESLRIVTDAKQSGDIFVTFTPGWTVTNDIEYPPTSYPVRSTPILAPAFIMAPGVASEVISTPVDVSTLAPTVAGLLHIRSPNGAVSRPYPIKRK